MNFRAIDPTDPRSGLPAGSNVDREVWKEYFDPETKSLRRGALESEFQRLWGGGSASAAAKTYTGFGDAPNDDPTELQQFAAKVRRGQPAFRKNLLAAYGGRCVISGHGPGEVLEAVHIVPHSETGINELDNGLLLRADLHSLLDAGLIRIEPDSLQVVVDKALLGTPYREFTGMELRSREDGSQISDKYLREKYDAM